jgi:uncharacterized protein YeaO (DUF488 family)
MTIALKRAYDPPAKADGCRILVDRLWPRGVTRDKAEIDLWLKDLSPSDALRKQYHGHPDDWPAFVKAYAAELRGEAQQAAVAELRAKMHTGKVTLIYASKDETHNNAAALRDWLTR